jgi:hypothetical protein
MGRTLVITTQNGEEMFVGDCSYLYHNRELSKIKYGTSSDTPQDVEARLRDMKINKASVYENGSLILEIKTK